MTARLVLALALVATAAGGTTTARADGPGEEDRAAARSKKLYAEGQKLFDLGKFAPALTKFEAAYEAKPIPGLLFNIGQCHRNLDDYDAAIFSFRKYLKLLPDAPNRDAVLVYIDELEREKQQQSSANLKLTEPDPDPDDGQVDVRPHGAPIYKKWWFWGGIALIGAGTGALILTSGGGTPGTDLGNIDFGK